MDGKKSDVALWYKTQEAVESHDPLCPEVTYVKSLYEWITEKDEERW